MRIFSPLDIGTSLSYIAGRRHSLDAVPALSRGFMQDLPAGKTPPDSEARSADSDIPKIRDMIGSLFIALKNHTLYPEEHSVCRKSVAAVQSRLAGFLADHDFLHLDVEEDRFLYEGEVVHQGPTQNDYLPFQLFRDGILWLEFHRGLTAEELSSFFKLLIRYRTPKEEAEGDLVTALWESAFPHIQYRKVEVLWKAEPLIDFCLLKTGPGESRTTEEGERESPAPAVKIAIQAAEPAFWKISPEEEKAIRKMVLEEETRDNTEDVLEVLTIILTAQGDPKNFTVILEFLAEEFAYALAQGEFPFVLKFLENLDVLRVSVAPEEPWTLPLLNDFRQKISGPDVLGALEQAWPIVGVMEADRRDYLRRALLWFPADVVLTLGPMLAKTDLPIVEQFLMEIIGIHAGRDLQPMAHLLSEAEEPLVRKLISLLRGLDGQGPADLLFGLTRHPSVPVCRDAIHILVTRDPQNLRKLFPLIEDSRFPIRRLILDHLGKRRNRLAEELLLKYLEKDPIRIKDRQHILACYRALGQCGSTRSLLFLQESLLGRAWKAFLGFGNSLHRRGAALALMAMTNEKAAQAILESAARSSFSGIRFAHRHAIEETRKQRKETGR
jgi:hypothetical protein